MLSNININRIDDFKVNIHVIISNISILTNQIKTKNISSIHF